MKLYLLKPFLLFMTGLSISSIFFSDYKAIAQVADVPNPDSTGDFSSAFQRGNLGFYTIDKWLVVQPMGSKGEDYTLNCRYTPNGEIRSRIQRGAIITAVFQGTVNLRRTDPPDSAYDAIFLDSNGSPWLRIRGLRDELAYPAQPASWDQLGECYVRANLRYIAPINPDSISSYPRDSHAYCKDTPLYCQSLLLQWLLLGRNL